MKEAKELPYTLNIENFISTVYKIGKSTFRRHLSRACSSNDMTKYCASLNKGNTSNHATKCRLPPDALTLIRNFCHQRASRGQATTTGLLMDMLTSNGYEVGSKPTFLKYLKQAGWCWMKNPKITKSLEEKLTLRLKRDTFSREFLRVATSGDRNLLVFSDESYCHRHHSKSWSWFQPDQADRLDIKMGGKGPRLCIIHAGTCEGFVAGAKRVFDQTISSTRDYHGNFNSDLYLHWIRDALGPGLRPGSILVIDNAPFHKSKAFGPKHPMLMRKEELRQWLIGQGWVNDPTSSMMMLKSAARQLLQNSKSKVEAFLESFGHRVLWTPPYHSNFQPIELIWARAKGLASGRYDNEHTATEFLSIVNEVLDSIDGEYWAKCVEHVVKEVQKHVVHDEEDPLPLREDMTDSSVSDTSDDEEDLEPK